MTNYEQLLFLAVDKDILCNNKKDLLVNLFNKTFYNSDLYKIDLNDKFQVHILDEVLTFAEAQSIYNLSGSTLHKNIKYGRYIDGEIKKSGTTWLITRRAMKRLYPSQNRYPKKLNEFLIATIKDKVITEYEKDKLINLCMLEYPNMDIYEDNLLDVSMINSCDNTINIIDQVMTFAEATTVYNLYKTTLRKNVDYGRYLKGEVRQSQSTWLITKDALNRLYGDKIDKNL